MSDHRVRVLFICLGNICRSPLAEGVFRELVRREGLTDRFEIDSAGTSNYHVGDAPDMRTAEVALRRGIRLDHVARQIRRADVETFDYIVAMDRENLRKMQRVVGPGPHAAEIRLLRAYDPQAGEDAEVPDPYFGGPRGFEEVHDMVERACQGLLEHIREQRL